MMPVCITIHSQREINEAFSQYEVDIVFIRELVSLRYLFKY